MDAGTIAGIASAVTAVVGAIAGFIYKVRGRSWREIFKSVVEGKSEEVKELANTVKEQTKVVGAMIEKELEGKSKKYVRVSTEKDIVKEQN